jgi:protein arginine kinase
MDNGFADIGLGWLEGGGAHADIVLSTRVRLARNLQGHAFSTRIRDGEREQILERVRRR